MVLRRRLSCGSVYSERVDGGVILQFQLFLKFKKWPLLLPTRWALNRRSHRGQVERRLPLLVLHGGIGSVGQQQSAQLGPPLLRRLVERRERPLIGGVDARVVLDQQGSDVNVLDEERQQD